MCYDTLPGWIGRLDPEERARYEASRRLDATERQLRIRLANDPYDTDAKEKLERLYSKQRH